jgi:hypothetical protein
MLLPLTILASSDDSGVKIVFGVIALIVWGINALVQSLNKQKKDAGRRAQEMIDRARAEQAARLGEMASGTVPPPIPQAMSWQPPPTVPQLGRSVQRGRTMALPPIPAQRQQQQQQAARRGAKKPKPQKVRQQLVPAPPPQHVDLTPIENVAMADAAPRVAPRAAGDVNVSHPIAKLLRKSLRGQMIVNEVLMPPLALRPPRDSF